jgi:hypothetical protein
LNSFTFHGQLENLSGQLEAAGDRLSEQIHNELNKVSDTKLNVVPTIQNAVSSAKKFISQQTGLDVPKYIDELNKLQKNLLTRYDEEGNPVGTMSEQMSRQKSLI